MYHLENTKKLFRERVVFNKNNSCWLWSGTKNPMGYGLIKIGRANRLAHRISWEIFHNKKMPSDMSACHFCDTTGCVNPSHIWPGTHAENMKDSWMKGRNHIRVPGPPKEYCNHGHKQEKTNVYIRSNGKRTCAECVRLSYRKKVCLPKEKQRGPYMSTYVSLLVFIFLSSCASAQSTIPKIENRTLRLSPDSAGLEYQWKVCLERFIFCTKYGIKKDYYDLTDPVVRKQLIDMGFVVKVKEKI